MPDEPARPHATGPLTLTDGGIETVLLFVERCDLPCFAAFPLVDDEAGRAALRRYYDPFLDLALDLQTPFLLDAPTWRANPDWGRQLGYDEPELIAANQRSVAFVDDLRRAARPSDGPVVLLEGVIGPRRDSYPPGSGMTTAQAQDYHSLQLRALAESPVDQVLAMTIADAAEAVGIVRAARSVSLPVTVSFTLETDGRLPDGQPLGEAIEQVDRETDGEATGFMINCAHPTHFADVLATGGSWRGRIVGLRANASTLSHADSDAAETLDDGDPADLAARYLALRAVLPGLRIAGGCCGTDIRHVTAIAEAWLA